MKKLLAVTAMAAMVAGAAFAAPSFSISNKLAGNLVKVDTDGDFTILGSIGNKIAASSLQGWEASASGEKAGAAVGSWGDDFNAIHHASIWFKPVDMVTLTLESSDWGGNYYGVDVDVSPVSVSFKLPGNFYTKSGKLAAGTEASVSFSDDTIGSVSVTYGYKETWNLDSSSGSYYGAPALLPPTAEDTGVVAVSYSGSFSPVKVSSDTVVNLYKVGDKTAPAIGEKLVVSAKIDTISLSATNIVVASPLNADQKLAVEFARTVLNASMPVADYTAYATVTENNWLTLKDAFSMTYKVGLKGKLDVMSWDVGLQVAAAKKTVITVPFTVQVGL